jgi:hypothetical protein
MDISGVDTSAKTYWGPRLWTVFHYLAENSDRRDMVMLWNKLMQLTAASMPCEQCRAHLSEYMRTHIFVRFAKMHLITGDAVKARATSELFALHNAVNSRLGKPAFTNEEMEVYRKPRGEALPLIIRAFDEIKAAWTPLVHTRINGSAFNDWKKHVNMMIALASGGPLP